MRAALSLLLCLFAIPSLHAQDKDTGWPVYGATLAGQRFSPATQITPANLSHLHPVWTIHTRALDTLRLGSDDASFEATPILDGDTLYLTTPFDVVLALDATTGVQRWTFDPHTQITAGGGMVTSRGVALWRSPSTIPCQTRIFLGTLDARLLALDAATGKPCLDFGSAGSVDLTRDVHYQHDGFYSLTSPPTIVGNIVLVGSSIGDNQVIAPESGLVRAFDAITGHQLWSWEPLASAREHPNAPRTTAAANTWSVIAADPTLNLVYLPTGSASPDYYGGLRPGDDRDADSVVALDILTGKKVWAFQTVHHDLWDDDVATEPLLFTFRNTIPAIAITTKTGQLFVLDRRTGTPLYPIAELTVPQSNVPGEQTSPTQPISSLPSLSPLTLADFPPATWQRSPSNQQICRAKLVKLRYDGLYTPPSTQGSLLFPSNLGGVNWGSAAFDPATGILYANTNREAFAMRLIPPHSLLGLRLTYEPTLRDWPIWLIFAAATLILASAFRRRFNPGRNAILAALLIASMAAVVCIFPRQIYLSHFGYELSPQRGSPYMILREPILDADGDPCTPTPWGATTAINLNTGQKVWEQPLGTRIPGQHTGILNFGGPIVTASGLVFTAAAEDPYLRALDAATGNELWSFRLPVPAQSTPMTYTLHGRQYLVVAAGGHADNISQRGDSLIAFALDNVSSSAPAK